MSEPADAEELEGELAPAEMLEELLEEIAAGLGLDAEVEVEESPGVLSGRLIGDDVGLFIGRRGQTIEAVQTHAAGYRERRAELLRSDADEAAEEAIRDNRPVELDPMPASERRIVHE